MLVGGRATVEDAYAYSKFARMVLGTNDIDFRARPHSDEEAEFLAAHVAGQPMTVTYADLENAPAVLLAGFEPEEESPIVFLRLRKAARKNGAAGDVDRAVRDARADQDGGQADRVRARRRGRRAGRPGRRRTAEAPRRAHPGRRATGRLPRSALGGKQIGGRHRCPAGVGAAAGRRTRRPGSRCAARPAARRPPVGDASAREQTAAAWNVDELPTADGRDTTAILAAARDGELGALLIGGVELADLPDPDAALAAVDAAPFVVSLELRESAVTELADVVFPVAPVVEKAGSFVNWEGRIRPFEPSLQTNAIPDLRVLALPGRRDRRRPRACRTRWPPATRWPASGCGAGQRPERPAGVAGAARHRPARVRRCWRAGGCCSTRGGCRTANRYLAGTARPPVARLSAATAAEIGAADGDLVTVSTDRGEITLPLAITDMPDRVVWLPLNSAGSAVHQQLAVTAGAVVSIGRAVQ